jgi:hypothetical protein
MERITTVAGLKSAIQILEVEQNAHERILKENLHLAYDSLKPVHILKNALKELMKPPYIGDNLAGTAMGVASGLLLRKLFFGSSDGPIKRLFVKLLQIGVSKIAASKADAVVSAGMTYLSRFFQKKGRRPEARDDI